MLKPEGQTSITGPMPAIGPGGPLPRRVRRRRVAAAFVLLLLLGVAKLEIPRAAEAHLAAGPGRLVVTGLVVGAAPSDLDLEELADTGQIMTLSASRIPARVPRIVSIRTVSFAFAAAQGAA